MRRRRVRVYLSDSFARFRLPNDVTRMSFCHQPNYPRNFPSPPTGRRRLRALVVDDNRDAAYSLAVLLRIKGHEAWVAYDGPSALVAALAYRPEVVFLDLAMPGLDGFAVAASARQQEVLRGLLLVAVTGFGGEEYRRRAKEVGFDHFFLKPVDLGELDRILAGAGTTPDPAVRCHFSQ